MVTSHNFKTTLKDIVIHPKIQENCFQKTYDNFTRISLTIFKNFSLSISLARNTQTQGGEICSLIK